MKIYLVLAVFVALAYAAEEIVQPDAIADLAVDEQRWGGHHGGYQRPHYGGHHHGHHGGHHHGHHGYRGRRSAEEIVAQADQETAEHHRYGWGGYGGYYGGYYRPHYGGYYGGYYGRPHYWG